MVGRVCRNNCQFCSQARERRSTDKLSRVIWPHYPMKDILDALRTADHGLVRVCFQCLDYEGLVDDLVRIAPKFRSASGGLPMSASIVPIPIEEMERLKKAGYSTISIAIDAANEEVFDSVKGGLVGNRFRFNDTLRAIEDAHSIFGNTYTHIIVGLGETDKDIVKMMSWLKERGIGTALFAYTNTDYKGTVASAITPSITRYRAIQLLRVMLYAELIDPDDVEYDSSGMIDKIPVGLSTLEEYLDKGYLTTVFSTSGCPGCNRPYYNEKPTGPMFNSPVTLPKDMTLEILKELEKEGLL